MRFFSDVKKTNDELFFYDSSELISKCILLKTYKANKYLISEVIICDEQEKDLNNTSALFFHLNQ